MRQALGGSPPTPGIAAAVRMIAEADGIAESEPGRSGVGVLIDAVQRLSLARSVADVQAIVRTAARALCGADGATFVLRDGELCFYADEDAISPLWKGQRFPMEACISGWAMQNRRSVAIGDIYADERIPHDAYRPTFVKSLAMVPIRQLDPIGAIGNYWADYHRPTEQEIALLQALADSTAVAMENVRVWGELEGRVTDRTARLRDALALNERVLGTMAHEIRNALAATVGLLDVVLDAPPDGTLRDVHEELELARGAVNDGIRVVNDQLAAAKDRAGELTVRPAPVDLGELLTEVGAAFAAMRRDQAVDVHVDVPQTACILVSDRHLLGLALRNLVSNALKFTDAGEVRLQARHAGSAHVEVSVSDTGVGIDEADRDRIFAAWAQVESEQAGRAAGSGLGLSFVRRVVDLLGGEIKLDSQVGSGSVFTIVMSTGQG